MTQRPEAAPRGTRVRIKADGREGYIYLQGGKWEFFDDHWVGDYTYVFCSEEQPADFDETRPPDNCFLVDGEMVEPV